MAGAKITVNVYTDVLDVAKDIVGGTNLSRVIQVALAEYVDNHKWEHIEKLSQRSFS